MRKKKGLMECARKKKTAISAMSHIMDLIDNLSDYLLDTSQLASAERLVFAEIHVFSGW